MPRTPRSHSQKPPVGETPTETPTTPKTTKRRSKRRRTRKPSPGTIPFKVSYGGGDSVILYRKVEHRGTTRYVMRELFD